MNSYSLSQDLQQVLDSKASEDYELGEFINASGDKAFGVALLILSLPSALPIPATGISTPLGIAMFFIGLQMLMGRNTLWLPEFVLKRRISHALAEKMVGGLNWCLQKFEVFVRPRFGWLSSRGGHMSVGLLVCLLSLVMQMPIPLTNTLPAAVIFVLAVCQMEDDGLLGIFASLLGTVVVLAYIVGFTLIAILGMQGFRELLDYF